MQVQSLKQTGSNSSKVDLPESIFGQSFNAKLVDQFLSTYISNSHQKTKGQKNRSAVRGGGRKPWRQKGTGRARAGTIRSPIWRGGGVTFAHNHAPTSKKINKKMYKTAIRSILSRLHQEDRILILDSLQLEEPPKTSQVKDILNSLKIKTVVFLLASKDEKLIVASKNLYGVSVQTVHSINPTELLKAEKVILVQDALNVFEESLV
ncbi:MAG: 50S ribosomal protein L4 [Gammaproteobacteria bacterium]